MKKDTICIECEETSGEEVGVEISMGNVYRKWVCRICGERWYTQDDIPPENMKN